jgi:hypothetical protein
MSKIVIEKELVIRTELITILSFMKNTHKYIEL